MSYPAYAEMKDSGVEWIGNVPSHWEPVRFKFVATFYGGGTPSKDNASYWKGDIPWVSPKDMKCRVIYDSEDHISEEALKDSATRLIEIGAVLIVVRSGILKHSIPVAINAMPVALNQDMKAIVPKHLLKATYLAYLIDGCQDALLLEWRKAGTTVESLEHDYITNTTLIMPPVDEQLAIAAFLDRKTIEIDTLIGLKERQLEVLEKKRQALISHAITRGLNSSAPLRPSTIDWLGDIPTHWDVKPLMYLTPSDRQIMYGIVLPGPHVEKGVPIVKSGDVAPLKLRLDKLSRTSHEIEQGYERSRLRAGDIVYSIRGSIGMAEIVPAELEGANLTQDAARVSPLNGVNRKWLLFALKSQPIFAQLEAGAVGATIRGINIRDLKRAYIPVPPEDEQQLIANYLDHESSRLDAQVETIQAQIDKLRDYRQSLISAAVTGKIDVRGETDDTVRGMDKKWAGRRG